MSNDEPKPKNGVGHLMGHKVCGKCRGFGVVYMMDKVRPDGSIEPQTCDRCNGGGTV